MDGTLVNNLAYHFLAFDEYVKREGFTLLEPVTLKINGMHSNDIFPLLLGDEVVAKYGLDRLNREKEEVYRDMYRPKIEPIAGIIELLQAAKKCRREVCYWLVRLSRECRDDNRGVGNYRFD